VRNSTSPSRFAFPPAKATASSPATRKQLDDAIVSVDVSFADLWLANLTADLVSAKRDGSHFRPDPQIAAPTMAATRSAFGLADPVAAIPTPATGPLLI